MKRACLLVVLLLVAVQPTDAGGQDLAARDGNALLRLCAATLEPNAAGDGRAGVCIGTRNWIASLVLPSKSPLFSKSGATFYGGRWARCRSAHR